ncbi:hypothetical protein [Cytobacillus sp. FSL K6-0129]
MSWRDLDIEKINTIEKLVAEFEVLLYLFLKKYMKVTKFLLVPLK